MKRLVLASALVLALLPVAQAQAASFPCGLPQSGPLRVEYAGNAVQFRLPVFGRPGVVAAVHDAAGAKALRLLGARTVYWFMKLGKVAGTPGAPADPASVEASAQTIFDKAVEVSDCTTPVIVLNELWGQGLAAPWDFVTGLYRQNVLALVRSLSVRGAVPVLLVPGPWYGNRAPNVDGEAGAWWQEVARYAHIVREMHFNARIIHKLGPIMGARRRRVAMRNAVAPFIRLGIPPDHLGLLLGFQSGRGKGGREGLEPRSAWFGMVKQDALAARQVTGELGLGSIWSWGWATFDDAGADPDKRAAACVYLWVANQGLCNGPAAAGPGFNASLTQGQIILPPDALCDTPIGTIAASEVDRLAPLLGGSRSDALAALFTRLIHRRQGARVLSADITTAEGRLLARSFTGDGAAYEAYLSARGLDPDAVREIVADQLRAQDFNAIVSIRYVTASAMGFAVEQAESLLRRTICRRDEIPPGMPFDWKTRYPELGVGETTLSIESDRYNVRRGRAIVLRGVLSSERVGEQVTVYGRSPEQRSFTRLGVVAPAEDGSWTLRTRPGTRMIYRAASASAASPSIVVIASAPGPR